MNYLPMAYAVVAAIIVVLVLVCVSPLVQNLARWLMRLLPKTENGSSAAPTGSSSWMFWARRAAVCWRISPAALKFWHCRRSSCSGCSACPTCAIRFMGLSCGLSFWQVQLLTSLMLFLSNALPNVAGMGSIETAFLLVFSSFMTSGEAMSTLMLFRIASYYFVFAASAAGTFAAQKHLENS